MFGILIPSLDTVGSWGMSLATPVDFTSAWTPVFAAAGLDSGASLASGWCGMEMLVKPRSPPVPWSSYGPGVGSVGATLRYGEGSPPGCRGGPQPAGGEAPEGLARGHLVVEGTRPALIGPPIDTWRSC